MTIGFLLLGLGAGVLTTVAGQGGGLLLLLACSALIGPHAALAVTAVALLLGNLHRALLLRKHLDRPVAVRILPAALVGAAIGGLLAGLTPPWALRALLVALTAVALAKAVGLLRFTVPRAALAPVGFGLGAMTGTSGGAGILLSPLLLSTGLSGLSFVATTSTIAVAMHVGRVAGYATLGLFSTNLVLPTALVSVAIFAGNALGKRLKVALSESPRRRLWDGGLEYGTLIVCVVLSVAGLG